MNILEIVIHRQTPDGWPVVAKFNQTGDFLPRRWEGTLKLDENDLLPFQLNPLAYGVHLGERLFCDSIRDALREARASTPDRLRVQLIIEAPDLRHWRWETLCGPIGVGGKWQHLTLDQRSRYSLYLPSLTDRRFPAIGRQDLRALIVVANPPEGNRYKLNAFSETDAIAGASQSLGNIPYEALATTAEVAGKPTIDEMCWRLTTQHYTILHLVAHGLFRTDDGETILYLLDDKGDVRPITATAFIDRLQNLQGVKGLPHLIFLASCESAASEAERAGAMGGLGQRLVRELGVPAVIAMTQRVSVSTANELASKFYERLNDNGDVVGALVDATAYLAEAGDITVPAIYERLGGRLLFDNAITRELTNVEIISGLERLQALFADQPDRPGRAPILTAELSRYAAQWRRLLLPDAMTTPRQQLSPQAQAEWLEAESGINALCEQALDLPFRALALGQEPAPYDARCPFPGLAAFRDEFKAFFFGRERLVAKLVRRWKENNFLAILGPSGSGKSSLVLAGIVPQMKRENPNSQLVYMTPTANPLRQLAAAQLPEVGPKSEILLLVDQFEELFTLCADEKTRQQFLDQLLALTEEMRVVITMRADFWGDCAPYPALRQLMLHQQELIAPMTLPELRSAMEQQADVVGLRFEDDLVYTILSEVEGEAGAMPLLQHLLKGLWEHRRGRWLLTREYRALGGIRQAIAVTAQTVYDNLNREEQAFMKHIFVRLTHLDESGDLGQQRRNTRRRVALPDLAAGGKTLSDVRAFVYKPELRGLLITAQRDDPLKEGGKTNSDGQNDDEGRLVEVEVIHEAVIRHWDQLQEWLDQDYEMLRQRQRIQQEAADWRQATDPSLREGLLLLHGSRLLRVKEWRDKGELALNQNENAYVVACDQKEQAQQQRELEQQRELAEAQRQRAEEAEQATRRQKRLTKIAYAIGVITFLLGLTVIVVMVQRVNEQEQARKDLSARYMANEGEVIFGQDPLLGIRLLIEATEIAGTNNEEFVDRLYALVRTGRIGKFEPVEEIRPLISTFMNTSNIYAVNSQLVLLDFVGTNSVLLELDTGNQFDLVGRARLGYPGTRRIGDSPFLLIQYWDKPAEIHLAYKLGRPIAENIASVHFQTDYFVGNLASLTWPWIRIEYMDGGVEWRSIADGEIIQTKDEILHLYPLFNSTLFIVQYVDGSTEIRSAQNQLMDSLDGFSFVKTDPLLPIFVVSYSNGSYELRTLTNGNVVYKSNDYIDKVFYIANSPYLVITTDFGDDILFSLETQEIEIVSIVDKVEQIYTVPGSAYFVIVYKNSSSILRSLETGGVHQLDKSVCSVSDINATNYFVVYYCDYTRQYRSKMDGTLIGDDVDQLIPISDIFYLVTYGENRSSKIRSWLTNEIVALDDDFYVNRKIYLAGPLNGSPFFGMSFVPNGMELRLISSPDHVIFHSERGVASFGMVEGLPFISINYNGGEHELRSALTGDLIVFDDRVVEDAQILGTNGDYYVLKYQNQDFELWDRNKRLAFLGKSISSLHFSEESSILLILFPDSSAWKIDIKLLEQIGGHPFDAHVNRVLSYEQLVQFLCNYLYGSQWDDEALTPYLLTDMAIGCQKH